MLSHAQSMDDKKKISLDQIWKVFLAGVPFRTNRLLNREHGNYENYL